MNSGDKKLEISQASVEAAELILALQKLAYQSEAELYNDWSLPPMRQTLDELRSEFQTHIFLQAIDQGQLIGSVRAHEHDGTCHIGRLMVHPAHQARGIGSALMHVIEARFPQATRFTLFTGAKSEGNIRLYQKLGYHIFETKQLSELVATVSMQKLV